MRDNNTEKTKKYVRFDTRVQSVTIRGLNGRNSAHRAWYTAEDFTRFRQERRQEIEALKRLNIDQDTHLSYRGNEQLVFQSSQLRLLSRAIFARRVLDQQDYENMKPNDHARVEDRLAAKVCRWSMSSVDQAIMRAQLDVEHHQTNQQHCLENVYDLDTSNLQRSLVHDEQKNNRQMEWCTHYENATSITRAPSLTRTPQIKYTQVPSSREGVHATAS